MIIIINNDLHLDVAARKVEDGALGHDCHGVALAVLGVLRGLGLALDLGPGIGFYSVLELRINNNKRWFLIMKFALLNLG